jgi:predicted nucleic-acid-binding protein
VVDAVDTNVLVRYLLQEDPEMGPAAARLMNGGLRLGVSLVVLTETVFVLSSNYGVPWEEVVDSLVELLRKRNIEVLGAEKALVASALMLCRPSGLVNYADG